MTLAAETLAERLVKLKRPCEPAGTEPNGLCTSSPGMSEVPVLPNDVRVWCDSRHRLPLHGIGVEDKWEYVSCAKAGCPGFSPSTRSMDWWRAWWSLRQSTEIGISVDYQGNVVGSVALLGRFVGRTDVDVLQMAIAAVLGKERLAYRNERAEGRP